MRVLIFFALVLVAFAPVVLADTVDVVVKHERGQTMGAFAVQTQSSVEPAYFYESRTVTSKEYQELVDKGYQFVRNDRVQAFLSDSVPLIGADEIHSTVLDGVNFTGRGETACVIDTGVDYTHSAFGSCDASFDTSQVGFSLNSSSDPFDDQFQSDDHDFFFWSLDNDSLQYPSVLFDEVVVDRSGDAVCIYHNSFEIDCITSTSNDVELGMLPSNENIEVGVRLNNDFNSSNTSFVINGLQNNSVSYDCPRFLGGFDFVDLNNDPMDEGSGSHGTHVAGIFGGDDDEIRGVAPGANIVGVRSLNAQGGGFLLDVKKGINYCIENKERFNISTIIMSLGTDTTFSNYCDSTFTIGSSLVQEAALNDIFVASATGNSGSDTGISSPACLESSFRVGATNKDDSLASYTDRGSFFDDILLAPGTGIVSSLRNQGYNSKQGTSMAAPHVAGFAALLKQQGFLTNASYNNSVIWSVMNASGVPVFDSDLDTFFSRIDVLEGLGSSIGLELKEEIFVFKNQTITYNSSSQTSDVVAMNISVFHPDGELLAFQDGVEQNSLFINGTVFEVPGTYMALVQARNNNNISNNKSKAFTVSNEATFNVSFTGFEPDLLFHNNENVTFFVENFSEDFNVSLLIDDVFDRNISEDENISINLSEGIYNFSFEVSNFEEWMGSDKKSFLVNVSDLTPYITSTNPSSDVLFLDTDEIVLFEANATNPSVDALDTTWFVDGALNSTNNSFVFNSSLYNESSYDVSVRKSNRYGFDSFNWTVSFKDPAIFDVEFFDNESDLTYHLDRNVSFMLSNFSDVFDVDLYVDDVFNASFENGSAASLGFDEGVYNVSFRVEEDSNWSSVRLDFVVNVSDLRPVIESSVPEEFNVSLVEGEVLEFIHTSFSPKNNSLSSNWSLDSAFVSNESVFLLNTSQLGVGSYDVELDVFNVYGSALRSWNVSVLVNSSITVSNVSPEVGSVDVNQFSTALFDVNASSDLNLSYNWTLNGSHVSNTSSFVLNSSNVDVGVYDLYVNVSNDDEFVELYWNVSVTEPLSVSIVEFTPNRSVVNASLSVPLAFNQSSLDFENRSLMYYWFVNSTLNSTSEDFVAVFDEVGRYNVSFVVGNGWSNTSRDVLVDVYNNSLEFVSTISDFEFEEGSSFDLNLSEHLNYSGYLPLVYSLNGTSSVGLSVDDDIATFTSSTPGTYTARLLASNAESNSSSNEFEIRVRQAPVSDSPSSGGTGGGGGSVLPPSSSDDEEVVDENESVTDDELEEEADVVEETIEEGGVLTFFRSLVERSFVLFSSDESNVISRVEVFVRSTLQDFSLEISHLESYDEDIEGLAYRFVEFRYDDELRDEFAEVELVFKVENRWLEDNNVSVEDVGLKREGSDGWEDLHVDFNHSSDEHSFFIAEFVGLSVFSIVGMVDEQSGSGVADYSDRDRFVDISQNWLGFVASFFVISLLIGFFVALKLNFIENQGFHSGQRRNTGFADIESGEDTRFGVGFDMSDYTRDDLYKEVLSFKTDKRRKSLENLLRKTTKTSDVKELKELYLLIMQDYDKLKEEDKKIYQDRILEVYNEIKRLQK